MLFLDELSLPGMAHITGAFASPDGSLLAVASSFVRHAGRMGRTGGRPYQRVALYRPPVRRPIAVFDDARLPVNDVAFHPNRTVLAIATGQYDGGHLYEGALFTFDWTTGQTNALGRIPTVRRARFADDATIEALVTWWNDRVPGGVDLLENPDDVIHRILLPIDVSWRDQPFSFVESKMTAAPPFTAAEAAILPEFGVVVAADPEAAVLQAFGLATLAQRGPVLDIALLATDAVAMVHDSCWLEVYGRDGLRRHAFAGPGHGIEILAAAEPLVHVATFDTVAGVPGGLRGSRLLRLAGGSLHEVFASEERYAFSIDARGTVLGLPGGYRERLWLPPPLDILVDVTTGIVTQHDFGPHSLLGIDRAPLPTFLGREPSDDPARGYFGAGPMRLCTVSAGGEVARLWPLDDLTGGVGSGDHALAYVDDEVGRGFIFTGRLNEWPNEGFILRSDEDGHVLWRQEAFAGVTAIRAAPGTGVIVVAFYDGTIILFDAATGVTRRREEFTPGGFPTVATAIDIDATHVAIGMADGRCGLMTLDEFMAGPVG